MRESLKRRCFLTGVLSLALVIIAPTAFAQPMSNFGGTDGSLVVQPFKGDAPSVALLVNRAVILSKAGNNEQAAGLLRQALTMDPNSKCAHLNLAAVLTALRQGDAAMHECEIVTQLDPSEPRVYLNYVGAAIMAGRLRDALSIGQTYLEKFPHGASRRQIQIEVASVEKQLKVYNSTPNGLAGPSGYGDNYLYLATPNGRKCWDLASMPLRVFINPPDDCEGFRPVFNVVLTQAFRNWEQAMGGLVRFVPARDSMEADIECRWTDNPKMLRSPGEGGETQTRCRIGDGRISHASIILLTYTNGAGVSPNLIWATSLHEIGHALGIEGHSDSPHDILYAWAALNVEHAQLSPRDVNTMRLLYR